MSQTDLRKNLASYTKRYRLYTEGLSFIILVPLSTGFLIFGISISRDQIPILLTAVAIIVGLFLVMSTVSNWLLLKPIKTLFTKILDGAEVSPAERSLARKRLQNLPVFRAFDIVIKWVVGIGLLLAILSIYSTMSVSQKFNLWILMWLNGIFSFLLYYLMTSRLIRK